MNRAGPAGEPDGKTEHEPDDRHRDPHKANKFIVKAINEPGRNLGLDFYGIDKPDMKLRDNFEAKFKKNYREYAAAYEGAQELLAGLKEAGHFVALASNAPRYTLDEILQKSGIFKFFDLIVGADKNVPQKPDPAMLNLILKSGEFNKAIFVGDSKKDELAARNANMKYRRQIGRASCRERV